MKEDKKEKGKVSRRDFLVGAGATVVSTIGAGMLAGCGGEPETITTTKVTTVPTTVTVTSTATSTQDIPASQGYLIVDSTHCAGCYSCMMACSMAHEGKISLSLSRIQILQDAYNEWPADIKISQCRQCQDPLCVRACLIGACYIDTDNGNVRTIDETKCIGCKLCIKACPFIPHRTIWNPEENIATKCDLCANTPYWDEEGGVGGKQACVEICPENALKFVIDMPSQTDESGYEFDLTEGAEAADTTETGGH